MSATQSQVPESAAVPTVPTELASAEAKLVYLYLAAADGATVDDLHESLGIKKITLFPVLDELLSRDLATRDGKTYAPQTAA